ncbi:MAG: hypothetical protein RR197_00875 [Oscillospiraceae bacterium]
MIEVVVTPSPRCPRIAETIAAVLGRRYATASLIGGSYKAAEQDPPEFLVLGQSLERLAASRAMLVVTEGAPCVPQTDGQIPVLLCGAPAALSPLSGQIISVGLGARDTITASSLAGPIVASLQRPVTALSGAQCGPLELPVDAPPDADVIGVLAAAAVLILSDLAAPLGREADKPDAFLPPGCPGF